MLKQILTNSIPGGNTEVVNAWGPESSSYMQALHFCFSLGGVIAPFIAQPFLAERSSEDYEIGRTEVFGNTSRLSFCDTNCSTVNVHDDVKTTVNSVESTEGTNVQYAYAISAGLVFSTVFPFVCMYYLKRDDITKLEKSVIEQGEPTNFQTRPVAVKVLLLLLISLLMCVYCGTEDTYAGYLMTFVTSYLEWSKAQGSYATSVFWICFGSFRLICIPLVRYVQTFKLMLVFSTLLALSFTGLLFATVYKTTPLVWIFIGAPGVSMSILFPAIFTWTNNCIVKVSGKIASLMMTSASVGIMAFPVLFGYTMDHISQLWFIYLLLGQSVLLLSLLIISSCAIKILLKTRKQSKEIELKIANGTNMYIDDDITTNYYKAIPERSESTSL